VCNEIIFTFALAVQNIRGDLFSALTIALDKPFEIGDFINVGDYSGVVEHVGLKSSRVRSLTAEQLVFANTDFLNSRIQNSKRMQRRRIVFSIGVTYQTHDEKLAAIPRILQEAIACRPDPTFDRAHLRSYTDFSISFEVVYFMENPDLMLFMDTQQDSNLAIFKRLEEEQIEFTYPIQAVFLEQDI
jgi:small-conductance mechanosensitive channel